MIRYRYFFALILLVISLVLTSGGIATAAALLQSEAQPACCEADANGSSTPLEVPCSEPDCQCLSCLAFVVPVSLRQSAFKEFLASSPFNLLVEVPPIGYFKSIDYPPEFS